MYEEVAFVAHHFHWPLDQLLNLEHGDRRHWAEEISKINKALTKNGAMS